jgi:hypothetical protein
MKKMYEGQPEEELEWVIASDLILHLEGVPTFYYPELIESQDIYLYRTTGLRWRLESDIKTLPEKSILHTELVRMIEAGDKLQADIARLSHPKGHNYWTGIEIPEQQLTEVVGAYRLAMTSPIRNVVKEMRISAHDGFFASVMLEDASARYQV